MRKYLDIPLTAIVAITLTVAMLWPLEAPPPAPEGSDKLVHFIAFAALAFPLARTGRLGLIVVFIGASAFGGLIELIQPALKAGGAYLVHYGWGLSSFREFRFGGRFTSHHALSALRRWARASPT